MSLKDKYVTDYSWRTIVRDVILLGGSSYRVSVSPIDYNNEGALLPIEIGYTLVDNAGHLYVVTAVGEGTIDVFDILDIEEHPASGLTGIICKSANKGRALLIPQGLLNYLDKTSRPYLDSVVWSILWDNDPNALDIALYPTQTPTISGYQVDQLDGTNLAEDYGENASFTLFQQLSATQKIERSEKPNITYVDGLIDSVDFGDLWEVQNGLIIKISKS